MRIFLNRLTTANASAYRLQLLYNVRQHDKQLAAPQLGEEHDDFKFVLTAADLENLPMLPAVKTLFADHPDRQSVDNTRAIVRRRHVLNISCR